jgi:uncharacterized glyoxalase superfamily protein PhnB
MPSKPKFTQAPMNVSMPSATVVPVLEYPDVQAAAAWLCHTFGFSERLRIGDHRIQLNIGEGAVVLAKSATKEKQGSTGNSLMIRVVDVDQHYESAMAAGLQISFAPASYPYGERQYTAEDLAGHVWTFSQSENNVEPSTWGGQLVQCGASEA